MEMITTNNVNLHNITKHETLRKIDGLSKAPGLDVVVTPNIDHLARLVGEAKGSHLHEIYKSASLCLCDSRILEKLLQIKNKYVKEVITGSSLTQKLFDEKYMTDKKGGTVCRCINIVSL